MSRRIASSSRPIASTSASVRWANCLISVMAMRAPLVRVGWCGSDAEDAVAGGGRDAGLDSVALAVDVAVAQVAHVCRRPVVRRRSGRFPSGIRTASATPTLLAGLEQGRRAVDVGGVAGLREGDGAALTAVAARAAIEKRSRCSRSSMPPCFHSVLGRVEHGGGPQAHVWRSPQSGHDPSRVERRTCRRCR